MKAIKRKALRINNRSANKKPKQTSIYVGEEEVLLNKVVEVIVKIIKKEIDLK
jgi:hypothetical protein